MEPIADTQAAQDAPSPYRQFDPEALPPRETCRRRADLLRYFPRNARRVLDTNPGDAGLAHALKRRGTPEVVGIVRHSAQEEAARPHLDRLIGGGLDAVELLLPRNYFDVIVCDDNLADYADPPGILQRLLPHLAEGGLFIATLPNLQHHACFEQIVGGSWAYGDSGPLARRHLKFFTPTEGHLLLEEAGLHPVRCQALVEDPPDAFPLDADGCVRHGRLTVGPLTPDEHRHFLIRHFVALGQKPRR